MFIGPVYSLTNNGVPISTAITAIQLKAGTNGPCEILRAALTQAGNTTSTQPSAGITRKSSAATVTAAVSGTTLHKHNNAAPTTDASLSTSGTGITASAEGTNSATLADRGFNILNGYEWLATPEERIMVATAGIVGLTFLTAPPSSTWYASFTWRELRAG